MEIARGLPIDPLAVRSSASGAGHAAGGPESPQFRMRPYELRSLRRRSLLLTEFPERLVVEFYYITSRGSSGLDMSGDRSRERRQLAAERLIFAQQMADWKIRASVLGMTQRWLDLAEPREPDAFDKALRLRAIQTKLGQKLRAHYGLPEELSHGILRLLMQLNAPQDGESGATAGNGRSRAS
jgi:hypothetical protein